MIHVGIRCSECGRVHFLLALRRLRRLSRLTETPTKGVYRSVAFPRVEESPIFELKIHDRSPCPITFTDEVTLNLRNTNQFIST
jgi:hypothetical protein